MTSSRNTSYDDLALSLLNDAEADVTLRDGKLTVRGEIFASLAHDGSLLVHLPERRAADLIARRVAALAHVRDSVAGVWVKVGDVEDWAELAGEAHKFVGAPPTGGLS